MTECSFEWLVQTNTRVIKIVAYFPVQKDIDCLFIHHFRAANEITKK